MTQDQFDTICALLERIAVAVEGKPTPNSRKRHQEVPHDAKQFVPMLRQSMEALQDACKSGDGWITPDQVFAIIGHDDATKHDKVAISKAVVAIGGTRHRRNTGAVFKF